MSHPAIVPMTDPSRCSLGDVHCLVQALLQIQQMGEHAIPQAFCDHPEAAKEFVDAYVHAYPQLVLEDCEIPTPDNLHSLISTGQIGALVRPDAPAWPGELQAPVEQNGTNTLPIVMLTVGSSQALLDALQQAPAIRDSIRLIDVGPERTDSLSVSIADAVAARGPDGEGRGHESRDGVRPELDEIAGVSTMDAASLTLHDGRLKLDMVETEDAPGEEPATADEVAQEQAPVASASTPPPPPVAISEPNADAARSDHGSGVSRTIEPVTQTPTPVESTLSSEPDPAKLAALLDQDLAVDAQTVEDGDQNVQEVVGVEPSPGEELAAAAAKPAPAAAASPASPISPENGLAGVTTDAGVAVTASAAEPASQPVISRPASGDAIAPSEDDLVEPSEGESTEPDPQSSEPQAQAPGDAANEGNKGGTQSKGTAGEKEGATAEHAGKGAPEQEDDVPYPPVGTLLASADVVYPALDGNDAYGVLHELVSVLLDDSLLDSDLAAEFVEAQRGENMAVPACQEAMMTSRSGHNVVTLEDVYAAADADEDLAGTDITRPLHDSDL